MEKKRESLSLKTKLKNIPISKNLRLWRSQNFTELINLPKLNKNKLNISFVGIKNTIKNNTSFIKSNLTNESNFFQFTKNEHLNHNNEELSKSTFIQGNTFKLLLNQNFSNYTLSIKKLYPTFKFNHYQKTNENIIKESFILKNANNLLEDNNNYTQNNLLDILGLQENITNQPENFLIKRDFLERTSLDELIMIKDDLVLKTLIIDKELNRIVSNNTNKIYVYIEKNINIGQKMDSYLLSLKSKRNNKIHLKKKFIGNSAKLFLVENKKQNIKKLKYYLTEIKKIKDDFQRLDILGKIENDNKIQGLKESINKIKNQIMRLRNEKIFKSMKIISEMEKELKNYENKGEEYLLIEFTKFMKNLLEMCLFFKEIDNINKDEKIEFMETQFKLNKDFDKKDKDTFPELDFEYDNFDFMLIYNNIEEDSKNLKIRNTLILVIKHLDMIIKSNLDIKSIIIKLKEPIKAIINNLYNKIQTLNYKETQKLYLISNAFTIILSNYFYLLFLFQINFSLQPAIFKELTTYIRNEMDLIIKNPINKFLNQFVVTGDLKVFHEKSSMIERKCSSYLNYTNLDWYKFIGDLYQEFFKKYYDKQVDNLKDKLRKENWEQFFKIKSIYQDVFDLITNSDTDTIEDDEEKYTSYIDLDIDNLNKENEDGNINIEKTNEYILFKTENEENNSKHKIIHFTLYIIKFIYESLFMYSNLIDENYQKVIVVCTYKTINDIIKMEKDIIINSSDGKINGTKLITEKESALLISNILVTKRALQTFLIKYPFNEIKLTFQEVENSAIYSMKILLNQLVSEIINLFKALNFQNYPIFQGKGYNEYIFKFTKMKKIYDNMKYAFLKNDIVNIFNIEINNIIDSMEHIVKEKPNIENDIQLKQFRREMVYMRKLLEMFDLFDVKVFKEKIENISKIINPNKAIKKKKKVDKDKKVEEDDK